MNKQKDPQRLRIVHIISGDRWAGAEVQVYTLLSALATHHEVYALVLNEGELASRLKSAGVNVKIFDETSMSVWQILFEIRRALKSIQPNVVHTHRKKENVLGSVANKTATNAPSIRTVHGAPEFKITGLRKIENFIDWLCAKYLQHGIIAVSEDLKEKIALSYGHTTKVIVLNNGLSPEDVRINIGKANIRDYAAPPIKNVGIIGRLEPVKRVDIFLEIAEIFASQRPQIPCKFHIFGSGSLEEQLKKHAHALSLQDTVFFHGHRMDIRSCINELDAVVMCSDHEGLPMTALEALALNKPVIAHDVGGLSILLSEYPEWKTHNHSASAYASILGKTLSTPPPTIVFPEAFHIRNTVKRTVSLYNALNRNHTH